MGTACHSSESHCGAMKFLILLATIAFASAAERAVTCDECKAAAAGLVDRLTTDASIEEQTGILVEVVCPVSPDPAACEQGLTQYWGDMAQCLYPEFIGARDVCTLMGLCNKSPALPKEWTCEEC